MAVVTFEINFSTLMPVLLGVTLIRFVVMGHYALHRRVYPGFRTFVLAEFCALLGMAGVFLRSGAGEALLPVLVTGLGSIAQQITVYHGLGVYCRLPRLWARTRQNMLLAAVAGLALAADLVLVPDIARRVMIYSAASLVISLRVGLEIPLLGRRKMAGLTLLCVTFLVGGVLHGVRGWNMLGAVGYDYSVMMRADPILTYLLLFRTMQSVLEFYVVFSMNSQLLEDDLRAATAQVAHMAQTDALTGALNRRGLEILGAEALRKSLSQGRPASVIMLDLDHFKRVNDTLGHVAGDELLRDVAALC
ncbi:MAG TPA: diguanylate cyclase, partial [Humidesulfovibrio sp.]|uniref:GGDEF domain-containing protein n=1 Tax=Humidesulfovibrio sp. TaxID=2910988 RepID=UPI002BD4A368